MKKMTKRLACLVLALVLACCALPEVTYGATTSVDLNQNYLFRARTNAFSFGTGETANLTFTPQYTAEYTLKLYGHVTGGRNIRASLTNPDGTVSDFEYPNRTGSTVKDYSHPYLTATLEQGKTYTYSVWGWTAASAGATVDVDFTSGESGTLSREVGLRLYLDQTEFTTYSQQAVLNAMKLLIVDRTGAHLEWKYKDAMGSLLVGGADVIVDLSACGACGKNTVQVHYMGYTATADFNLAHDYSVLLERVAATPTARGYDLLGCSRCSATTRANFVDYDGFCIATPGADMGALLFNDTDVTAGGRIYVDRGKDCTLLALPNSGCRFAGWQQGNKILSGDASYTFTPVASATYTPLFLDNSDRLTFLFIDPFSNVLSYQQVDSAADVKIPTPPTYTGYTFVGWSYTPMQIHSATGSLTVQALYRAGGAKQLTITAPGCTLQCGNQTARNSLTVAYGARVTVSASDAKGFSADGRVLGYGSRYSFYAVADLALEKCTDDLTPVPSVSLLSAQLQSDTGRVMFAATRSMAGEGNRLVTSGFLYGKNLADDDLVLEMAGKPGTGTDAGTVRCAQNRSTEPEGQFVLYYGISAHVGTAAARAYLTYADADGALHTVYSAVLRYTY